MRLRFIIPGDINTPSGGYRYDRTLLHEWQKMRVSLECISLPGAYPTPNSDDKDQAFKILTQCDRADLVIIDGLAGGGFPELIEQQSKDCPCVSLIHHPLCLENGLSEDVAAQLEASEGAGLDKVKAIITTSKATRQKVIQLFKQADDTVHTIEPGVVRDTPISFRDRSPLHLLSVGSITRRKGHDVLLEALARLLETSWKLTIIGSQNFDPDYFGTLKALGDVHGMTDRLLFLDGLSDEALARHYQTSDIFVLASHYEGYGMAYAEAIVRGLPVIGTTAGAIPNTVPEKAGLLVPPGNVEALSQALFSLLHDAALRRRKHQGALAVEPDFPTWSGSANKFLSLLEKIV